MIVARCESVACSTSVSAKVFVGRRGGARGEGSSQTSLLALQSSGDFHVVNVVVCVLCITPTLCVSLTVDYADTSSVLLQFSDSVLNIK